MEIKVRISEDELAQMQCSPEELRAAIEAKINEGLDMPDTELGGLVYPDPGSVTVNVETEQ
ncbi:MAG: hypothetical protein O9327_02180 [Polaromonas sp.]|nr:hypothetical protein [Polaromonas sp.]